MDLERSGSVSASARSLLSPDVQDLMEELGIADPIEEEEASPRQSAKDDEVIPRKA